MLGQGSRRGYLDDPEASGCVELAQGALLGVRVPWALRLGEVGLEELPRLPLLVGELQLQASKWIVLPAIPLLVESVHTLADGTHDGRGLLGSLEGLRLGELVAGHR